MSGFCLLSFWQNERIYLSHFVHFLMEECLFFYYWMIKSTFLFCLLYFVWHTLHTHLLQKVYKLRKLNSVTEKMHNYVKQNINVHLSFKNWKTNTLSSKSIQTEKAKFSHFDRMRGDQNQIFRTIVAKHCRF